jgi:tRNA modification GTPase
MPSHQPALDTIVAISTPPGRGGIGIVRLSGPGALTIAAQLLQLAGPLDDPKAHAHARRARVLDPDSKAHDSAAQATVKSVLPRTIDDAIVTVFFAPNSYTGEDVAEIAAHGSPVILDAILRSAVAHGARLAASNQLAAPIRLATPGEFTQRAFLSGRLDLTQAEAVHDLIAAQTLDQARVAAQQLCGAISRRVAPAKESLLHLIALLEAGMDFASGELDDVDIVPPTQIASAIASVQRPLAELAATFRRGQLLRNGAAIALIGPPNAGKSSLFNRLLERERAIVTPLPGTTRDTVEEALSLGGIPLRLIDTAGLRSLDSPSNMPSQSALDLSSRATNPSAGPSPLRTQETISAETTSIDLAEQQGIARSHEALADADLILLIHDATQPLTPFELHLAATLAEPGSARPHLIIHNKIDLLPPPACAGTHPIRTSALTGFGLDDLRQAILAQLGASGSLADTGSLNNLRQQEAITATLAALSAAAAANALALPHELILLDLHTALRALDSLTGATTPDDILARIFSTFCIGK